MAEKVVKIEGTSTVVINNQPIGTSPSNVSTSPLFVASVPNPAPSPTFVFSRAELAGVVAANNYLTLYNPVGSGKSLILGGVFLSTYAVGDIAVGALSMRGYRLASAPSGGTLEAISTYGKFITASAASIAEVRTGTVTATPANALFNSPPFIASVKSSSPFVHMVPVPGLFTMVPGEGLIIRSEAGDVDQRWNISVAWAEQ
jgi:hypothetical protein